MNERTSVASFAHAFKSTLLIIGFKYTSLTRKFPMFLSCLNEIRGGCEKILPVSLSFWSNLKFFKMMGRKAKCICVQSKLS